MTGLRVPSAEDGTQNEGATQSPGSPLVTPGWRRSGHAAVRNSGSAPIVTAAPPTVRTASAGDAGR
jgi:hypothetical protein